MKTKKETAAILKSLGLPGIKALLAEQGLRLQDIADEMDVSASAVTRAISRPAGAPPHQQQIRTHIAGRLGFDSWAEVETAAGREATNG